MSEESNHAEYAAIKKYEGKYKLARTLMITGYIMFPIVGIVVIAATPLAAFVIWFIALFPMMLTIIIPLTYRYVQIEYEYSIDSGLITFSEIYGRRARKQKYEIRIGDALAIAPYRDDYRAAADAADEKYGFCSTMTNPELYYILFESEDGKKITIFFDPINKALKLMKFHNRNTVVVPVRLG
jgi:hypothetical protein